MSARALIASLLAVAFVFPVGIGAAALWTTPGEMSEEGWEVELARMTARLLFRDLAATVRMLELGTGLFDLAALPPEETTGVLRMLYKQDPELTVVALLDADDQALVEPAYLRDEQLAAGGRHRTHLPMDEQSLGAFLRRLPIAAARESGRAFSDVYADRRRNSALIAGALVVSAGQGRKPFLLAFERSLRRVQQAVAVGVSDASSCVFVVDGGGRLVGHPDGNRVIKRESLADHPLVKRFLTGEQSGRGSFQLGETNAEHSGWMRGAFWKLDFLDWAVVVQRPGAAPQAAEPPAWALIAWLAVAGLVALGGVWVTAGVQASLDRFAELERSYDNRAEELKRVQASLLETRKLNAIGDLGAGVAHEFNNPIGGILGLTQLLLRKKREGDPDMQFLRRIEAEAQRCKIITDNLLRFSEQQGGDHREPLRVERVMDKAVDLINSRLDRERVRVERDYAEDCPRIIGNEWDLQRAFLNVLLNAETAMPDGGHLTLKILAEDDWVVIRVADTGRGIAPANLERVFDPFFTTKDNWKGAGLGLWVVYQIVQDHQGGVTLESEEGRGTVVTFRLPREEAVQRDTSAPVPLA